MTILAVVIHDEPLLRAFFVEALAAWVRHGVAVEQIGYAARLPGQMKRWMDDADLFVIGLERHYKEGHCAEGVDVAESLFNFGKRVLVVGSECSAKRVGVHFYWDVALDKSFLDAVGDVLANSIPSTADRKRFAEFFEQRRAKADGHGPARATSPICIANQSKTYSENAGILPKRSTGGTA
jgi:hypothetical protein